ncbi:MAG: BamA/TamA family outer membrane protein, partial [Sulfurimicrobium sp.]|nr:BamA/TamA family outer membrane protein [Sulfurimicrobium sp.]
LGPRDEFNNAVGGTSRIVGTAELMFPFPGLTTDKSVRLGVFVDGGMVFGKGDKIDVGEMRYAGGLSLSWFSPIGPLKFSLARPLNKKENDKTEVFQFQMGTVF